MHCVFTTRQLPRSISLYSLRDRSAGNAHAQQMIGGCPVLPANNIWNTPVDTLPVLSNSALDGEHDRRQHRLPCRFRRRHVERRTDRHSVHHRSRDADEIPGDVPLRRRERSRAVRGSAERADRRRQQLHRRPARDRVDTDNCILYELYRAFPQSSSWTADSGAIFDLQSNALRPATWTSADAAGLPIMPGLVTYDEVLSGEIKHAIRFTVPQTRREFVWPARHYASSLTGTQYPRMGERFRLKAGFDISPYPADVQVILRAMKKYGIMLADNGSAWFISGKPDARWNDDNLQTLGQLLGSNFEAVDATVLQDRSEFRRGDPERRHRDGQPVVGVGSHGSLADVHRNGHRRAQHRHLERERDRRRRRRRRRDRRQRPVPRAVGRAQSRRRSPCARPAPRPRRRPAVPQSPFFRCRASPR